MIDEPTTVAGVRFPNRVGVAAGVDKAGGTVPLFEAAGYGHVEVGTVTAAPHWPDAAPSLSYVDGGSIVNDMGYPNPGVAIASGTLMSLDHTIPVGINVGFDAESPGLASAVLQFAVGVAADGADYITVNLSTPNTDGVREWQSPDRIAVLLGRIDTDVPVFVKLAPAQWSSAVQDRVEAVEANGGDGVVLTNTREHDNGGISGDAVAEDARWAVGHASDATDLPVIGVGGVRSHADAVAMLDAGAALVQLHTAIHTDGIGVVTDVLGGESA